MQVMVSGLFRDYELLYLFDSIDKASKVASILNKNRSWWDRSVYRAIRIPVHSSTKDFYDRSH